ncbi:hypothetical protein [Chromobacterium haemolyticum]|uniref:hypothetical protein n=1 Tax=Chromobacterium haemolyticum TaxID=394935 RepID=UPI001745EC57|nr:hypothetical protein [Chromobacterium haemolyticum]QOD84143.1 hypothetical protein IEZ30_06625 [Chromobacterium haemolyticum]
MTAKKKPKCRTCGGYCGKKKGQRCQFAANEAKRRSDALWGMLTAGMRKDAQ